MGKKTLTGDSKVIRTIVVVLFLSLNAYAHAGQATANDFDRVCGYFKQLQQKLKHTSLSNKQRALFMNHLIHGNLKTNNPVRQSWDAILSAVPEQRYDLFKETASEVGRMPHWKCVEMKSLYPTIGD